MEGSAVLPRRVGLPAATLLVVGGTVGIGIFVTLSGMTRGLSSPALLFGVWGFMGAAALCGALCFGELAARYPEAGGGYVYLREAFGPGVAFLFGWKCLLVMDPGLTATLATALGTHAHLALPWLPARAAAVAAILLAAAVNFAGVRLAAGIGEVLSIGKLGLIVLLIGWGCLSGAGDGAHFHPFVSRAADAPPLVPALAGAIISAFFAFGGWWETSKLGGEIHDAARNLPRALAIGVLVITLLYVSVSAVFVYLVPLAAAGPDDAFALRIGTLLAGAAGGRAFAAVIALSLLSSLVIFMTMAPRVYYAMARDGVVPEAVGRLDPRSGAPTRAIAIQAVLAIVLVTLGTFDTIMAYFVFVTVAFLGLTVLGLVRLRRGPEEPPYRTPWFPATSTLFLVSIALVLALLALGRPQQTTWGVLVVTCGIPAYLVFIRKEGRS
jgi:basic amino acid/polyamine antiporter, APA family